MSKGKVKVLLLAVFGIFLCLLISGIVNAILKRSSSEINSRSLPDIAILSVDNKALRLNKVALGTKTVIFFFNPDCEHCHSEAEEVIKYRNTFHGKNIIWLSKDDLVAIKYFDRRYKLSKTFQSLYIGQISVNDADEKFGFRQVPSIYVYDEDGSLIRKYSGVTKIHNILKHL